MLGEIILLQILKRFYFLNLIFFNFFNRYYHLVLFQLKLEDNICHCMKKKIVLFYLFSFYSDKFTSTNLSLAHQIKLFEIE